jgi:hypothetical protein
VQDDERDLFIQAGPDVGASDERHEQVRRDRAPGRAFSSASKCGGKRRGRHDPYGPQSTSGGHGARQIAPSNAAPHAGLDKRVLETEAFEQVHVGACSHEQTLHRNGPWRDFVAQRVGPA